jgi:hypothetical protein
MLKRWEALTGFVRIPGAPLDNNLAEQPLKLAVRYRNNSLFHKNPHGAFVGDVLSSLIETCRPNAVNPIDDLIALLDNRSAVLAHSADWLPRNFQDAATASAQSPPLPPLGHRPPIIGQTSVLGVAVPEQNLQLARREPMAGLRRRGPPVQAASGDALLAQPAALAVVP